MIGLPLSGMTDDEKTFLKNYFRNNISTLWNRGNWLEICPYGEARFTGNLLTSTNDLTNAAWTATNLTVTANNLANPADSRVTANRCLETADTGTHKVAQTYAFLPSINYQYSIYGRSIGARQLYVSINDGVDTITSYFNIVAGTVGTNSGCSETPTCVQYANGFWQCTMKFTSDSAATTGSVSVQAASNGSTVSYAGDTAKGLYLWGSVLNQLSYTTAADQYVAWAQDGENEIDAIFDIYRDSPLNASYPRPQGYEISVDGIQIIGPQGWTTGNYAYASPNTISPTNPVYLYYRKKCPEFYGADYSASSTYAIGDVVLFTNSSGVANYYKCKVATSAGQSPTTTPASWTLQVIPETFFHPVSLMCWADWLRQDGQFDKATLADQQAEEHILNEFDRLERQMRRTQPIRIATHTTSQPRF